MTTKINLTTSEDEASELYISFSELNGMDKKVLEQKLKSGMDIFVIKSGMMPIKLVPAKLG